VKEGRGRGMEEREGRRRRQGRSEDRSRLKTRIWSKVKMKRTDSKGG